MSDDVTPPTPERDPDRRHSDKPANARKANARKTNAREAPAGAAERRGTLSPWSLLLAGALLVAVVLGEWTWLIPILGLALLITVHEFGHFIAAKSFGMRVEKFYIGFPPAALRKTWGETEYGIGIIPLGGFCKISGMTPEDPVGDGVVEEILADAQDGRLERTYTVAELDLALEELTGRIDRVTVDGATSGDAEVDEWRRLQSVLKERRAGLLAPGGAGDPVYYRKAVWKRNITIAAGPFMNFVAAALILILFYGIQGVPTGTTLTLGIVQPGTPAARVGLVAGDRLLGADGATWTTWEQAQGFFRAHPHQSVDLRYVPTGGGPERTIAVTLATRSGQSGVGFLGVQPKLAYRHPGPIETVRLGLSDFKNVAVGTFTGFWWLATGKISATGPDGAAGPVGIISISHQAVVQSWYPVLLAFLSFNLGLINLLPILPFDGGHILMNVVERVRGRRLDPRVFERMVAFGTVLLVMLFIFLTFNDVKRLFGG